MSIHASELLPGATLLISLKLGLALEVRVHGNSRDVDRVVPSRTRKASPTAWTKVVARLDRYENGFLYLQVMKPMIQPVPYNGPSFHAIVHHSAIKRAEAINPINNPAKIHPFEEGRHIPWDMHWVPWQTKQTVVFP